MKALIAARKPSKTQGQEGATLDSQDASAREFCDRLGWEVVGVARDTISGTVAPIDRKQLGHWLKDRLHEFDAVVAYAADRYSRGSDVDWSRIETWAADNKKTLVLVDSSTGVRFPSRDDSDYWQWAAFKRQSRAEWEKLRERAHRSQAALVANGSVMGKAAFGYRIAGEYMRKTLVVFEPEAMLVREVFERVTQGESTRSVARWLTERSGRSWAATSIQRMILAPVYAGRLERNGQQYGECPAIVGMGEWTAAQRAMRSRVNKELGGAPPTGEPALMVMVCGECGSRMHRSGGAGGRRYYWCTGSHGFGVPVAKAEASVMRILTSSTQDEMTIEVVRGHDYSDEIETARRDRRQALEREDLEKVIALTEEIKRFEALPVEADRIARKPTGRKVGEVFASMDRDAVRASLRAWEIVAHPSGRIVMKSPWRRL